MVDALVEDAHAAFLKWREVPAPKRGEILREIREGLASKKEELGALISLEMGKILQEGIGEVQEAIDICDCQWGFSSLLRAPLTDLRTKHPACMTHRCCRTGACRACWKCPKAGMANTLLPAAVTNDVRTGSAKREVRCTLQHPYSCTSDLTGPCGVSLSEKTTSLWKLPAHLASCSLFPLSISLTR